MILGGKKASLLLLAGDILVFVFSLWLTLLLRYQEWPHGQVLDDHIPPFAFLFALWILVFYISGLYGKRIVFLKSDLANALLKTQVTNIILAALFFFVFTAVRIAPKTNLIIYLVISLALIFFWRLTVFPRLSERRSRVRAALIASGAEAEELGKEVNNNPRYSIEFRPLTVSDPAQLAAQLKAEKVGVLVVDTEQAKQKGILPILYTLSHVEGRYQFVDFEDLYEEVFDRIPLSRLKYEWFLENVSPTNSVIYASVKRSIDVLGGLLMGLVTVIIAPFIWLANKFEGRGPLFILQERVSERGVRIHAYKFRSMRENDAGMWPGEGKNQVTRVGAFLRKSSLDEFPQCINILRGDLSLIGPRNDLVPLAMRLSDAIPYYDARYLVRPGITGWAQINQQYEQNNISPQSIEETKTRLAYDFYYLKHRSLTLDIMIALKTLKRMFFRVSSW